MDGMEEATVREEPPTLQMSLSELMRDPYLRQYITNPAAYVDIFVDNVLGLSQGPAHQRCQVRQTLFHSLDRVLQPCDSGYLANRKEVLSLKKLMADNCMWST